ncbi:hypothetical protein Sango_0299200 [Sesamum angolense]|uniref:Cupin-like domain-containing protein n=1 Tax=Sesamum angolense TaxID=2727404 RepID=A0AAE1X8B0_9LAMI|nr:hypothetical protein Sango_0299200 [Sesamum angolense]
MEESLQIRRFELMPSAEEFASRIEPMNVPAVFSGCVKGWKAFSKWNVTSGGLDYLQNDTVLSENPLKDGRLMNLDIMDDKDGTFVYRKYEIVQGQRTLIPRMTLLAYVSHETVSLQSCQRCFVAIFYLHWILQDLLKNGDDGQDSSSQLRKQELVELVTQNGDSINVEEHPHRIYLAQPAFLEGKVLASVNLWMNNARSRSSTHYDPHHNLLCIISGCKQVVLWPPSACPYLYPLPLYGEASNHRLTDKEMHNFPRTLEAFLLHALCPLGVEVLTRKFEQMDQMISAEDRSQFYQKFYSVFDNQFAAMDALLNGKESFACQAFNNVLVRYLGISRNYQWNRDQ